MDNEYPPAGAVVEALKRGGYLLGEAVNGPAGVRPAEECVIVLGNGASLAALSLLRWLPPIRSVEAAAVLPWLTIVDLTSGAGRLPDWIVASYSVNSDADRPSRPLVAAIQDLGWELSNCFAMKLPAQSLPSKVQRR